MPVPMITRAYEARLDVVDGERSVIFKINTGALDRYRTVIEPGGIDLRAYRENPVVLWDHGRGNDGRPIARAAWTTYMKAEGCIASKAIFLDDEFADGIFKLYQVGALRGSSVAILPDPEASGRPSPEEIRKRPELATCECIYRKSELCEYSCVAVPGNGQALALAVSRGLWLPEELRATTPETTPEPESAEPVLPRLNPRRTLAEGVVAGLERLRRIAPVEVDRALRDRLDLLRGRV